MLRRQLAPPATPLRAQTPFPIVGAIIDRLRETNSLPYKHAFLPYAYGTIISLITRVAEDVDPYNTNQIFLPTEPSAHKIHPIGRGGACSSRMGAKRPLYTLQWERGDRVSGG